MDFEVRYAVLSDLPQVNVLRKQVNDLHANGRPESPYCHPRSFYRVAEFGVDAAFRRQGIATALIAFCREEARKKGFLRMELDMWEFNEGALKFYESVGFRTYRRYMEQDIE